MTAKQIDLAELLGFARSHEVAIVPTDAHVRAAKRGRGDMPRVVPLLFRQDTGVDG